MNTSTYTQIAHKKHTLTFRKTYISFGQNKSLIYPKLIYVFSALF